MRYQYCKLQFEDAIQFVSKNNKFYEGQMEEIRLSLTRALQKFSNDSSLYLGTMGFLLMKSLEQDEKDEEYWYIEIYVDPALGNEKRYESDDEDYFDSKSAGALN